MARRADFIIIGGGVMGCSIAYHLAARRAGGKRSGVVVLERKHIASGASGKSAAVIRCHYSNEITTRMALLARGVWEHFAERVGLDYGTALIPGAGNVGWHKTGMVIVGDETTRPSIERNIAMQRRAGVDTEMIAVSDLRALEPRAHFADEACGAFEADAGYVDPVRATEAFAAAARQHGAVIEEFTPATKFVIENSRLVAVETPAGRFEAGTFILATGAWSRRFSDPLGLELPIDPHRAQLGLFRQPTNFGNSHAVFADFGNMTYFKPFVEGYTHIGTIDDREARSIADCDHYNETADSEVVEDLRECLTRRLPPMKRSVNRGGWAGLYAVTPDWHPIMDRAPNLDNVYLSCGFSGHGFKLSPLVGQLMAELLIDGAFKTMDVRAFRYARFAEGDLVGRNYSAGVIG